MVIAPFLGPNMSMSFGTTLGDFPIIRKSVITTLVSSFIAFKISFLWGIFAENVDVIVRDPDIEYQDIVLALVCSFAGIRPGWWWAKAKAKKKTVNAIII